MNQMGVHNEIRLTRSLTRGNCSITHCFTKFGQTTFTIEASKQWNAIPTNISVIILIGLKQMKINVCIYPGTTNQN